TRGGVRCEVDTRAAGEAGNERGLVVQAQRVREVVAELMEVSPRGPREHEPILAADARSVAGRERCGAVAVGPRVEAAAEVLEAACHLKRVPNPVDYLPVDPGGRPRPGGGPQPVRQLGAVDAVEQ